MELKEFMEKWKVLERDIIEAGKLTSSICGSFDCENCPFDSNYGCLITLVPADVNINIGEEVEKRIQKLLHPNHMEKVAEMLGVKLGERFKISDINKTFIYRLEEDGLHLGGVEFCADETLTRLLTGQSYIIKEDKDE